MFTTQEILALDERTNLAFIEDTGVSLGNMHNKIIIV